jgi:hypothetical protein
VTRKPSLDKARLIEDAEGEADSSEAELGHPVVLQKINFNFFFSLRLCVSFSAFSDSGLLFLLHPD